MNKFLRKSARLAVVAMIPTLFLISCSDDMVEPDNAMPKKSSFKKSDLPR